MNAFRLAPIAALALLLGMTGCNKRDNAVTPAPTTGSASAPDSMSGSTGSDSSGSMGAASSPDMSTAPMPGASAASGY